MKLRHRGVLAGLAVPLAGLIPTPPFPWQIGPAIDNALYQMEWSIAFYTWQPHTTMMAIANVFSKVANALTTSILPTVATFIITFIQDSNIYGVAVGLALILAALSLLGSFLDLRLVDLKEVFKYAILISLVLTYGANAMSSVESFRGSLASTLYESAYSAVDSGGGMGGVFAAPAPTEPWAHFTLEDRAPPSGRITSYDAALSALGASASEAMMPSLPAGFVSQFFPHDSITSLSDGQRSDAIQTGWQGIVRLLLSVPLSWASVVESAMEVLFSIAGMILLISMPFVLVFGLFRPTQPIVAQLLQQYLALFINYVVVSMLTAIGVSGLVTAATTHSLTMMVAASLLSYIFYWFGIRAAWNAAKSSVTAATGSIAQAVGVEEPIGKAVDTVKGGIGMAVGGAGAVAAVAAGMPQLAPAVLEAGQSFSSLGADEQRSERRKGFIRAGLGIAGGMAMQGTPLQGPATAAAALGTLGGEEGVGEMVAGMKGADATMVGLSSRSPFGAVYALDRARRRRERFERKYGGSQEEGSSNEEQSSENQQSTTQVQSSGGGVGRHSSGQAPDRGPAQAPAAAHATAGATIQLFQPDKDSPWKQEIQQGIARFGKEWANEVAEAVRELADDLRVQSVDEEDVARHFVDDQGQVSFNSDLGRDIFDNLEDATQKLLVTEEAARKAALGVIGEEVMPERTITKEDLAEAVAYAVDHGGNEKGAGAQAVAKNLNLDTSQLGSSYGAYNSLVSAVRKMGHSGADVRQQILDPEGDYLPDNAKKLTNFMPSEIRFKKAKLN